MKLKLAILALIIMVLSPAVAESGSPALKALIVTGQNNHNWQASSPILKQILEDTGLFSVNIAVSPGKGENMAAFKPDFASYHVIVLDYNGEEWSAQVKESFINYVKNGGGVVFYHAADNSFPGWREYNEMAGLGGWQGRDEKFGPYLYWQDGKIVRNYSPGIGGYHGLRHAFQVINRDMTHPITRGLPERWMHAKDELYSLMRGPAKNLHVLATAYSAVEQLGTGRHEPVLFTLNYGKGRIFHTVLGHTMNENPRPALECAGFIVTFRRGAEWAATGKVTQEVPADFPATTKKSSAPEDVRRWQDYRPPSLDKILTNMAKYRFGQDTEPLSKLENYIRANLNSPAAMSFCEGKLLEFLVSGASPDAKQFACRQLRLMGTEKSLPVLIEMVQDEKTSDMARYALEKIPGKKVDRALFDLLQKTSGKTRAGIIGSIGRRASPGAAAALKELINNSIDMTAAAAITALGRVGDSQSAAVLARALKGGNQEHRILLEEAYLECAAALFSKGSLKEAGSIYKELEKTGESPSVKTAALGGRIACAGKETGKIILHALKGKDSGLHAAAANQVHRIKDAAGIKRLCEEVPNLDGPVQVQLISALSRSDSPAVLSAILNAVDSKDVEVRIAGLKALQNRGDASSVGLLAQRAAEAAGAEQNAARSGLQRLKGEAVDSEIILNLIALRDPAVQVELLQAIGERRIYKAKELVKSRARYGQPQCRLAALRALKVIGEPEDLPELIAILAAAESEAVRKEAENTTTAVAAKIETEEKRAEAVLSALQKEKESKTRCALLRTAGKIGCNSALPAVRRALNDDDAAVRDAAVRVLSNWPHPAAADDLLKIAKFTKNTVHHVLALQGYIRLLGVDKYRSPESAARCFREAMLTARRPEEKRAVLGVLPVFASRETLMLAEACLKDKELQAEAQQAAAKIKTALEKKE